MGRPPKEGVDYFPHYCVYDKDGSLGILESLYEDKGYCFFFKLLETLGKAPGHYLDFTTPKVRIKLCGKVKISEELCIEMLTKMVELEDIDKELWENHKVIWFQNYVDHLTPVYHKRGKETPPKPVFPNRKPHLAKDNSTESTQSKVKDSKEKKSKVIAGVDTSDKYPLSKEAVSLAKEYRAKHIQVTGQPPKETFPRMIGAFKALLGSFCGKEFVPKYKPKLLSDNIIPFLTDKDFNASETGGNTINNYGNWLSRELSKVGRK